VRKNIWEAACELALTGDTRNPAKVLAARFRVSVRTVFVSLIGDSGEAERSIRREAERHYGMIPNTIGA
jgi:hypothetical protein